MLRTKSAGCLAILFCLPLMAVRGHDFKFTTGRSALCIPFEADNRHVAFRARLNDRDGMWLQLDSGAGGSVIDATRAESLGLRAVGTHQSLGAGGMEAASTVHGVEVALPGLTLLDQTLDTLPLSSIAAQAGRPMDGILGHSLLSRFVVEIDYPRRCLSVFDPSGYEYSGPGVSLPITFKDNLPYVKATVVLPDGRLISGKFVIDTGASTSILLSAESVERERVTEAVSKTITVRARGVGGAKDVRLARLARLDVGGFSLQQPIVALQSAGAGYISAPGTVGNIGGGILSRFKVVFDYPHRRMILEPGPDIDAPFEGDMSGLGLSSIPPDYKRVTVALIVAGSPALEAGVQAGDEIETVNGTPVGDIGLPALRERLRVDGQDVRLGLRRGTEAMTLDFRTRRMI